MTATLNGISGTLFPYRKVYAGVYPVTPRLDLSNAEIGADAETGACMMLVVLQTDGSPANVKSTVFSLN